ncbi:MAG: dihydroneopterin aldolase [Lentisphaeria bacterium]|nr:dihydroneopterin aldolase [Lentisphaeria bacterium]
MEKIFIENLKLCAVIGTLPHERLHRQELRFDLELRCDGSAAAASDDLCDAADYSAVERMVAECVEKSSYFLLEALAAAVGRCILTFPQISSCVVRIAKPGASSCGALISYQAEFHQESSRHEQ